MIGVCVQPNLFWLWQGGWEEETRIAQRIRWLTYLFHFSPTRRRWNNETNLKVYFASQVLMRALRDFNKPKIVAEDVIIFMGLLGDLFPGLEVERVRDPEFEKTVRQTTVGLRLQPEETFILKVWYGLMLRCFMQMKKKFSKPKHLFCQVTSLEELLAVRHSVFVLGNAGTGKSQVCFPLK